MRKADDPRTFVIVAYTVAGVVLLGYVAFMTARIASASGSTITLVVIGASLLVGALAAAAGGALGRLDGRTPAERPARARRRTRARSVRPAQAQMALFPAAKAR